MYECVHESSMPAQVHNFRVSIGMPRQLASLHCLSIPGAVLAMEEGAAIDSFSDALAEWR